MIRSCRRFVTKRDSQYDAIRQQGQKYGLITERTSDRQLVIVTLARIALNTDRRILTLYHRS